MPISSIVDSGSGFEKNEVLEAVRIEAPDDIKSPVRQYGQSFYFSISKEAATKQPATDFNP